MKKEKQSCGQAVLGLDVSLEWFDGGIARQGSLDDLRSIKVRRFPRSAQGVRDCLKWARSMGWMDSVVMEATGYYSQELASWFRQECPELPVFIANPLQVKRFGEGLGVSTKTDAQDTRVIACFGVNRKLWPVEEKSDGHMKVHRLQKDRTALVRMLTAERLRARGADRGEVAQRVHLRLCQELQGGIKALDKEIRLLVKADKALGREVRLLSSLPGVAIQVSTMVIGALGDLTRFGRGRQLTAYTGTSPKQKESGKSVRGRTKLCKKGNPQVKAALYLAALSAIRVKGPLRERYLALVNHGKTKMQAIGAIMRRILLLMRAILISGIPYDPAYRQDQLAQMN